jgi:hypothetical protein
MKSFPAQCPTYHSSYKDGTHIQSNGDKHWFKGGYLHREDGPAVISDELDYSAWYIEGVLHREDGPSIEFYEDGKIWASSYYYHGKFADVSNQKEFEQYKKLIAFQ